MSQDAEIRALERGIRECPGDAALQERLERAWLRAGRGWRGEPLPDRICTTAERGVYAYAVAELKIDMVWVPSGKSFYLGRCPVTWSQLATWDSATKRQSGVTAFAVSRAPHRPATNLSHLDALAFCRWSGLRLPSAHEWNCATLAGAWCGATDVLELLADGQVAGGGFQGKIMRPMQLPNVPAAREGVWLAVDMTGQVQVVQGDEIGFRVALDGVPST